jgi:hypothetical protein
VVAHVLLAALGGGMMVALGVLSWRVVLRAGVVLAASCSAAS